MSNILKVFLIVLFVAPSAARADCFTTSSECRSGCTIEMLGAAVLSGTTGSQYDSGAVATCMTNCDSARDACIAQEQQRLQAQQQQAAAAAAAQAEQMSNAASAKEIAVADRIAAQVSAESEAKAQVEDLVFKGLEALDAKSYSAAEYQFRRARELDPSNSDALSGQLQALMGKGDTQKAGRVANDALSEAMASKSRGLLDGLLDALVTTSMIVPEEALLLRQIHPLRADSASPISAHRTQYPSSVVGPTVERLGGVLPAFLADAADRRKRVEDEALKVQQDREAVDAAIAKALASIPSGIELAPEVKEFLSTSPAIREGFARNAERGYGTYRIDYSMLQPFAGCRVKSLENVVAGDKQTRIGNWGFPISFDENSGESTYCSAKYGSRTEDKSWMLNVFGFVGAQLSNTDLLSCTGRKCETTKHSRPSRLNRLFVSASPNVLNVGDQLEVDSSITHQYSPPITQLSKYSCTVKERRPATESGLSMPGDIVTFGCTATHTANGGQATVSTTEVHYSTFLQNALAWLYLIDWSVPNYSWRRTEVSGSLQSAGELRTKTNGSMVIPPTINKRHDTTTVLTRIE